jgi:hypothetical protein
MTGYVVYTVRGRVGDDGLRWLEGCRRWETGAEDEDRAEKRSVGEAVGADFGE